MKCYYAWNSNSEILHQSTSGGIFSALADYVFSRQGVVYGACIDYETSEVSHAKADSFEELSKLRGSKYQQSAIGSVYTEIYDALQKNIYVLFSGTPCQVAGLISFLKVKRIEPSTLLTVEVLCHGVTSADIVREYIRSAEKKYHREIIEYHYRTKEKPWYHSGSSMHLVFSDGKEIYRNNAIDPFYVAYVNSLILRPSCYACRFAKKEGRIADFTIGDFWGAEDYIDDKKLLCSGIGIVLSNTDRGDAVWNTIVEEGTVISHPLHFENAVGRNGALVKPVRLNPRRKQFFERYGREDFIGIIKSLYGKRIIKNKIKLMIGYDNMRKIAILKKRIKGRV